MKINDILKKPRFTEKSYLNTTFNKYIFDVDSRASKPEIKKAVSELFAVDVINVATMTVRSKKKYRGMKKRSLVKSTKFKKAVVEIKAGQSIKIFDEIFKSEK